ncbi:MAG: sigma-70 family RNA polymerase sigma factor [Deltaproteobacteria bacterium]|nr:sigma-70 family RNA polymerase sigma factor [Deltaproteobacteria bacterium]
MNQALSKTRDSRDELAQYMREVKRTPLLTRKEEFALAQRLADGGDVDAAHRLITANLRFVVKVAMEYRSYGIKTLDLVQEGNVGLMHAVRKFDPSRGYRLITYAVWWIRAYIQSYLLRGFSLVKMGTTQNQRRLFFKLPAANAELNVRYQGSLSGSEREEKLAEMLNVSLKEVRSMTLRTAARDFSLDMTLDDGNDSSYLDMLPDNDAPGTEVKVAAQELQENLIDELAAAMTHLNDREREIIRLRYLQDDAPTLREVGASWGVSRERARQIEAAARGKMKQFLLGQSKVLPDFLPGMQTLAA